MVERVQDLLLPNAVVTRIIKDALPDGIKVGNEARIAIGRAASVFVLYLSSSAIASAKKDKNKTLATKHVFDALEDIEFESFVEPLRTTLETYRQTVKDKKNSKAESKKLPETEDGTKTDQTEENDE